MQASLIQTHPEIQVQTVYRVAYAHVLTTQAVKAEFTVHYAEKVAQFFSE